MTICPLPKNFLGVFSRDARRVARLICGCMRRTENRVVNLSNKISASGNGVVA